MANKTVRLHIPDLSTDLHRAIKVAAAQAGKPLKEWVKDVLREKINELEQPGASVAAACTMCNPENKC